MFPRAWLSFPALALSLAMIGTSPITLAQTASPTVPQDQDHSAHHPNGTALVPAPAPAPSTGNQSGMMGGRMMNGGTMMNGSGMMSGGMGQMMMAMMGDRGDMMADRVDSRLAFLKAQLKITDAQTPQWDRFADALRSTATSMTGMHQMMQGGMPASLPDRMNLHERMLSTHLDRVRDIEAALSPLYAALNDEQKKLADQLIMSPMGMM